MSEENIIKNNELIAEFMGGKYETNLPFAYTKSGWTGTPANSSNQIVQSHTFRYNSSWNWLMPVVEKIESISELSQNRKCNFHVTIEKHRCFIKWGIGYTICDINDYRNSKISIVYKAVIEFIKWYNQNKKI